MGAAAAPADPSTLDYSALALSAGDPCGIGCEIVVRALAGLPAERQPRVVGSPERLARAASLLGLPRPARIDACGPTVDDLPWGQVHARAGAAAFAYVERAIDLARSGTVRGIVTAPISKAALAAAGHAYPGHTEILADLGGAHQPVAMMLANAELRVVLVTIHCALAEAIRRVDAAAVLRAIVHADRALKAMGVERPRVAVAGLNPHAGEDGLFGREDIEHIAPAIEQARRLHGIDASGPWPADTLFMRARGELAPDGTAAAGGRLRARAAFDVVVAQYHDQGLIPVKYLGIDQGVNITLGLPFVRTSPDHGTAFDIAGRGLARAGSLVTAMHYAARLATGAA